jgi:hypothetical protein
MAIRLCPTYDMYNTLTSVPPSPPQTPSDPFNGTSCELGLCAPGTKPEYNISTGLIGCCECPANFYKPDYGNDDCTKCPPYSTDNEDGTDCLCTKG